MNYELLFNSIRNLKRTVAILTNEREVVRIELGGDVAADLDDVIQDISNKIENMERGIREDFS